MPTTPSPKRAYLPKIGRTPGAVSFVLTERDLAILEALGRYRHLRTGQVSRLIFPGSKTVQSARRRLKSHTYNAVGRRRYRLFDEVLDPIGKRKLVVHPDMLFVLKAEAGDGRVFQRLFFVEIDRGTEGLRVIADKMTGYHLYKREGVFKKFGDFADFRVLIQTNSAKRAANIHDLTGKFDGAVDAWTVEDRQVNEETILHGAIWLKPGASEPAAILKK